MEFRIDELLDGFEDQSVQLQSAEYTSADRIKELTMEKIKRNYTVENRRRGARKLFTVMLAAALVLALSAGVFAAFSIHQKRQQQLRGHLKIDENHVASYVEYEEPEETPQRTETVSKTVTLVSAIRENNLQRVYVTLSPISREEALEATADEVIGYSVDGGISGNFASIPYDVERQSSFDTFGPEQRRELQQLKMEYSYDEETQSLLLACSIHDDDLPESGILTLDILRINGFRFEEVYGSVALELTALETRSIFFAVPIELYNDNLKKSCRVAGLELTPTSAAFLLEIEDGELLFSPKAHMTDEEREILLSWISCIDEPLCSASVMFADGSEFATGTIVTSPYKNGYVRYETGWESPAIDLNAVTAVRIGDEVRECP